MRVWRDRRLPMKIELGGRPTAAVIPVIVAVLCGCGSRGSSVDLVSYRDPYFPEPYFVEFDECALRRDAGGNHHLIARSTKRSDTGGTIRHYLDVDVFWKPRPGKTSTDSSSMDSSLRYAVVTPEGFAVYRGNGFVYLKQDSWSKRWTGTIESGHLHLESKTGDSPEILGDARIKGRLVARQDATRAVDWLRELELTIAADSTIPP